MTKTSKNSNAPKDARETKENLKKELNNAAFKTAEKTAAAALGTDGSEDFA